MSTNPIPPLPSTQTIAAYEQTDYYAEDQPAVRLRIGDTPGQHAAWLARHGASSATILTAWNPFGQELSLTENEVLQGRLRDAIEQSGLSWLPARGEDPLGSWEPEPGFCVFDLSAALLDEWLQRFRQNAVVRLEAGQPCVLVWHPGIRRQMG